MAGSGVAAVRERPEVAELAEGVGMERPRRDARQTECTQALDHLGRGLVGERDDEGFVRLDDVGRDRVRGASADDPRLARARPREDRDRTGRCEDGLALGVVQVIEESLWVGTGHRASMGVLT